MNFYLFKLRAACGVNDRRFHYQRNGIIAAESMEEAFKTVSRSYSEDPLGDEAIITQIVFLRDDDGDNICYIDPVELDRLNEFFNSGVTNGED